MINKRIIIFFLFFIFFIHNNCFAVKLSNVDGLHLRYNFGFWLTSRAATGDFYVKKISKNRFIVKLIGETRGVIGFFLNYRKDTMISEMIYDEKLHKFIPEKFIKQVIIGKNLKESTYIFNYNKMRIIKKKLKIIHHEKENNPESEVIDEDSSLNKKVLKKKSTYYIPLKTKLIDDYLTAAMNFITGIYKIPSKDSFLTIRLFPEQNKKKRNRVLKVYFLKKIKNFIKIKADLDVDFISDKVKKVYSLINQNMIPEKVEIPTGTIVGTLFAERTPLGKK